MDTELLAVERIGHREIQIEAAWGVGVEFRRIPHDPELIALRFIHGGIGPAQQTRAVATLIWPLDDAEAGTYFEGDPLEFDSGSQVPVEIVDSSREFPRTIFVVCREQNRELVTPEAGHDVG